METLANKHDTLALSRLQLFRNVNLDNPALLDLLSRCSYRHLAESDILLSRKKLNHHLYIVIKGRLAIQLTHHDDIPFAIVEPGECVGEMSLISSQACSVQVIATEETTLLAIESEILWRMISVSLEIARNLLYIMSERVRYSNLVIADSLDMQHKYQRFATTDALTGLRNRGWLDDVFDREIKRSERDQLPLCLLMIDVDDFKDYNDKYGHLMGDQVLIKVAGAIRTPLRPNDLVARFGGEEFVVLLPETTITNAKSIAERLRKKVNSIDLGVHNGVALPRVTVSLGIAVRQPGDTLAMMIAAADIAMYHAKRNGKNCYVVASDVRVDD